MGPEERSWRRSQPLVEGAQRLRDAGVADGAAGDLVQPPIDAVLVEAMGATREELFDISFDKTRLANAANGLVIINANFDGIHRFRCWKMFDC